MLTYKKVKSAIREFDPTAELIKGKGYHYFLGESLNYAYSTSVMVPELNQMSLESWVYEFKRIQEESKIKGD